MHTLHMSTHIRIDVGKEEFTKSPPKATCRRFGCHCTVLLENGKSSRQWPSEWRPSPWGCLWIQGIWGWGELILLRPALHFYLSKPYAIIHQTALLQPCLPVMVLSLTTGPKLQGQAIMEQTYDTVARQKPFFFMRWYSQVFMGTVMQLAQGLYSRKTLGWLGNYYGKYLIHGCSLGIKLTELKKKQGAWRMEVSVWPMLFFLVSCW